MYCTDFPSRFCLKVNLSVNTLFHQLLISFKLLKSWKLFLLIFYLNGFFSFYSKVHPLQGHLWLKYSNCFMLVHTWEQILKLFKVFFYFLLLHQPLSRIYSACAHMHKIINIYISVCLCGFFLFKCPQLFQANFLCDVYIMQDSGVKVVEKAEICSRLKNIMDYESWNKFVKNKFTW